jgi:hypothetical protein
MTRAVCSTYRLPHARVLPFAFCMRHPRLRQHTRSRRGGGLEGSRLLAWQADTAALTGNPLPGLACFAGPTH